MLLHTLPLTLAAVLTLVACNSDEAADGEVAEGEAVAAVPAPAGQTWSEVASVTPEGGIVEGNPNAPIKLIEYASHTCGHCAEFSEAAAEPLRSKYIETGKVSFELRNQIHDPIDLTIAVLARCAGPEAFHAFAEQGWSNLDAIFANVQANEAVLNAASQAQGAARFDGIATAAGLYDFFAQRGVSRDQAKACRQDRDCDQDRGRFGQPVGGAQRDRHANVLHQRPERRDPELGCARTDAPARRRPLGRRGGG